MDLCGDAIPINVHRYYRDAQHKNTYEKEHLQVKELKKKNTLLKYINVAFQQINLFIAQMLFNFLFIKTYKTKNVVYHRYFTCAFK